MAVVCRSRPLILAVTLALAGSGSALAQNDPSVPAPAPLALPEGTQVLPGFGQTSAPASYGGYSDANIGLPAFLTSGGIFDAREPDFVMSIRLGAGLRPAYPGSSETTFAPKGRLRIDYLQFPNGFEFGSVDAVGFRTGLGVRGAARYIPRRNTNNDDEIKGLDNIPWAFELGLGLAYEQRSYRVFADARYGIIGSNAWTGTVGADAIAYPIDGLTLTAGPRLGFSSSQFTNTYFGVSDSEADRSGTVPAFDADGGLTSAGVKLGARYLLNERWGVEGEASWDRLLNDAADSPITQLGSDNQYSVTIGVTRRISLDF